MPRKWNDAVDKYSEDTLQSYGIVPWQIEIIYKRLVYAFIEKDSDKIFDRYKYELKKMGLEGKKIDLKMKKIIDNSWKKQLEKQ